MKTGLERLKVLEQLNSWKSNNLRVSNREKKQRTKPIQNWIKKIKSAINAIIKLKELIITLGAKEKSPILRYMYINIPIKMRSFLM